MSAGPKMSVAETTSGAAINVSSIVVAIGRRSDDLHTPETEGSYDKLSSRHTFYSRFGPMVDRC